jgi:hypothetical protein
MTRLTKAFLVAAVLAFGSSQAQAGTIYFNAAAFEPVETGTGVACAKESKSGATAWDHTYIVGAFDPNSDEACVLHFFWQSDMPTTGNVTVKYEGIAPSSSGNVEMNISVGCSSTAGTDPGIAYGTATAQLDEGVNALGYQAFSHTVALPIDTYAPAAHRYCALKIRRDADHGDETLAVDLDIRGVYISY